MEEFPGARVMIMCRGVVVSLMLLFGCSVLQLPSWAQADQSNFLNIACGASESYVDPVTGLTWVPDAPYITTGKIKTTLTSPQNVSGMTSLRYFDDDRTKNCYALPVNVSEYYLLRTSFYYGNYDNAGKPLSFQLAIDGNILADIATAPAMSTSDSGQYVEFLFMPYHNTTFLCLIRTSQWSSPFISGITLIPVTDYVVQWEHLRGDLYQGYFMKTLNRVNYGGTELIRYPTDSHDYLWHPEGVNSNLLTLTTSPLERIATTGTIQYPGIPSAVMQTAVTTSGPDLISRFLPDGWPGIESDTGLKRLSFYWAELNSSTGNLTRVFNVSLPAMADDVPISSWLNGSFLSYDSYYFWDVESVTPTGPNSTLILTKTEPSSPLGPILNAMEFHSKSKPRLNRTNDRDALAIEDIKSSLGLTAWTGDPCLPYPHSWITCSSPLEPTTTSPNIIALNLSGYLLEGAFPSSFSNLVNLTSLSLDNNKLTGTLPDLSHMTNLVILRLQNNNLHGVLPDWLASMTSLTELSEQNNDFSGSIPTALLSSNTLKFTYYPGNPLLTGGNQISNSKSSSSNSGAVVGGIVGAVLGVALILGIIFYLYFWKKSKEFPMSERRGGLVEISGSSGAKAYTWVEVVAATKNFTTEIGKGGFGPVFYGRFLDGQEVAVKVNVLSRVRHKNLVALIGYCQEDEKQILIYEYMHNGSLHDHLHGRTVGTFDWKMRLNIALGAAQGLEYLHAGCSPSFIHRDIKSSNILISAKHDAKVADFGLTKLMPLGEDDPSHVTTFVKGTAGYLDPEYLNTELLSTKSDIYSFGVVLLELLTGRPPIDRSRGPNYPKPGVCNWARSTLEEGNIDAILAPEVRASWPRPNQEALWKVADVALQCVEPRASTGPQ